VAVTFAASVGGLFLILMVLWEGFETIILPRRVTRRFRLTRFFYRSTWRPWARLVHACVPARRRETWLSFFGPASPLILLSLWAGAMITGFALLQWAAGSVLLPRGGSGGFLTDLYLSGTTFFTLGLGDAIPGNGLARLLVVIESGMGFAFLALIIGYLPALNQTFSRREVSISLLDARAGSPPTAGEILRRHGRPASREALAQLLHQWERWSAELLEEHLSYPVLAYFRSQHQNQSWMAAMTAILDTCALVMAGVEGTCERQAELTFAMARHAVSDLCLVFRARPRETNLERLPPEEFAALKTILAEAGIGLREGALEEKLAELRGSYEPYVLALAAHFRFSVPPWVAGEGRTDNWQASRWEGGTIVGKEKDQAREEHF
jgi:Ion channel